MAEQGSRSAQSSSSTGVAALAGLVTAAVTGYAVAVSLPLRLDHHPPNGTFNLAKVYGENLHGLAGFVLLVGGQFVLYLLALRLITSAGHFATPIAIGGALILSASLLPAHPFYSFDVVHYAASARVLWVHHQHPMLVPPAAIPTDAVAALADWRNTPSPYGPLWNALSIVPHGAALLMGGTATAYVLAYKGLALALTGAAAVLMARAAGQWRRGGGAEAVVLLTWNPLWVLHIGGDAHNETALVVAMLAALVHAGRGRLAWASGLVVAAALVKLSGLLLLPVWYAWLWWRQRPNRWAEIGSAILVMAVTLVATYLPFWRGSVTFSTALAEGSYLTTSWPAVAAQVLSWWLPVDLARQVAMLASRVFFVVALAVLLPRLPRGKDAAVVAGLFAASGLLYLSLGAAWMMPWYVLPPLAAAAAAPAAPLIRRMALGLSFGALLLPVATNYLSGMSDAGDQWRWMNLWGVSLVWAPALLAVAPRPRLPVVQRGRSPRSRVVS